MQMPDSLQPWLAVLAGGGLGAIYFGGLWWTVRRAMSFRRPAASMLVSALLRMSVALGGFYLVAAGRWERLLLCLLGFVVARAAVTRLARPPAPSGPSAAREIAHAP
jgi:F1F0 ATPase subunit 2